MAKRLRGVRSPPGTNLHDESGWPMHSSSILRCFGLPHSSPIPPTFGASTMIGDTKVTIKPQGHWQNELGRKIKRRVMATCNRCGAVVCAGHLHQHRQGASCEIRDVLRGGNA